MASAVAIRATLHAMGREWMAGLCNCQPPRSVDAATHCRDLIPAICNAIRSEKPMPASRIRCFASLVCPRVLPPCRRCLGAKNPPCYSPVCSVQVDVTKYLVSEDSGNYARARCGITRTLRFRSGRKCQHQPGGWRNYRRHRSMARLLASRAGGSISSPASPDRHRPSTR